MTSAATTLHVSQPTVSVALKSLEKEVGGLLFERTSGGLALTAAGQALVEPARQILRDLNVASESVRDVLGLSGGHLDIGAIPAVGASWLVTMIAAFRHRYPNVGIRVHPEPNDEIITADVRSGRYNLGLTVSAQAAGTLKTQQVAAQSLVALLPPGSPKAGQPIHINELAGMDLVTMHPGLSRSRLWLETELQKHGYTPRIGIELGTTDSVLPLVTAGAGYALWWTPMMATTISNFAMRPIVPPFERPIFLLLREGPLSPATRAFLEIVQPVARTV